MTQNNGQVGYLKTSNIPFNKQLINISIYGSNTGESFYGISNYSEKSDYERLYFDQYNLTISMERDFIDHWNLLLGIKYSYYNENNDKNNTSSEIFNEIHNIGGIIGIQTDSRNQEYNTESGYFNEIKAEVFDNFQILSNDIRIFTPYQNATLAIKVYSTQTLSNSEHINYYHGIGNYYYLRGYRANDIIDKHLSYAQFEWRQKTVSWLIVTPFIEAGAIGQDIADKLEKFKDFDALGVSTDEEITRLVSNIRTRKAQVKKYLEDIFENATMS